MTKQHRPAPGVEMIDCFFCGSEKSCKFVNGKGYVVLGESKDGSNFGTHAMCEKCRKRI